MNLNFKCGFFVEFSTVKCRNRLKRIGIMRISFKYYVTDRKLKIGYSLKAFIIIKYLFSIKEKHLHCSNHTSKEMSICYIHC